MRIGCQLDGVDVDLKNPQNLIPRQNAQLFEKYSASFKDEGFEWGRYSVRLPLPITRNRNFVFEYCSNQMTDISNIENPHPGKSHLINGSIGGFTTYLISSKGLYGALTLGKSSTSTLKNEWPRVFLEGLAKSLHDDFSESLLSMHIPESTTVLTKRERETLAWAADGKTAAETATILNLSPPTVAFHLKNAMNKLNCSNKIQAAVKATSLGILRTAA